MESSGWVRLGRLVRAERSQRWRTRDDFAAAVGVSPRVLDDLETGRRSTFSPETLSAVEGALGWAHGTCERVVAGGQVVREVDPALARVQALWPRLSRDARVLVVQLVERLVK